MTVTNKLYKQIIFPIKSNRQISDTKENILPVVDHAAVVAGQERGARVLRGLQADRAHAGVEPLPGPETLGSAHHSAGTAGCNLCQSFY